jgi:hypothetical protein
MLRQLSATFSNQLGLLEFFFLNIDVQSHTAGHAA